MFRSSPVHLSQRRVALLAFAALPVTITSAFATLTPTWTTFGTKTGAQYGHSVAGAGDVNDDGYADVIVGSYMAGDLVSVGRVSLFLGAAGGLSTAPAWEKDGAGGISWFGYVVASAGDVNGDGYADVLTSAPRYRAPAVDEGRAYLFLGSAGILAIAPSWTKSGGQESAYYGKALASAGDVNGDGFSDVAVGAPLYDGAGVDDGRVEVFYGSASGLAHTPDWFVNGDQNTGRFGSAVASAGDVNDDGFDDLIVGMEGYGAGREDEGRALLFLGSSSGLSNSPAWSAEGNDIQYGEFGASVAGIGDVNGDGYDDVLIGAPEDAHSNPGHAYLFLGNATGLTETPVWTFEGSSWLSQLGRSVAGLGDLNGDGFDDFAIGEPHSSLSYSHVGNASATWSQPFAVYSSDDELDALGACVAGAGDVDGSGRPDWLIGAPREDSEIELNAGSARAFLGEHLVTAAVDPTLAGRMELAYPNPFRSETTLRYRLDATRSGHVTVWDANGRVLLGAPLSAGSGTWSWDGTDEQGRALPSGIYWIGTNEPATARRVVLTR